MFPLRPQRELRALESDYQQAEKLLSLPEEELCLVVPRVSRWSTLQHVQHLLLVNDAVWKNIRELLGPEGGGRPEGGRPTGIGRLVLVTGWIPRGKGRAPEAVVPDAAVQLGEVLNHFVESRRQLAEVAARQGELRRRRARIRHFVFGELNAAQWLRFARIHTRHHMRIIAGCRL